MLVGHNFRDRVKPETKQYAKQLRKKMTPTEIALWERLRRSGVGFKFRRQSVILGWIADFYCPQVRLVVEVDGGYHRTRSQKALDARRDAVMDKHYFTVLRFTNEEVLNDEEAVVSKIKQVANSLVSSSISSVICRK